MAENKVEFGFRNLYYALVTRDPETGAVTYGVPIRFNGAVSMTTEPNGETVQFYADDILYYSNTVNQGYTGTLTVARIPDDFRQNVMGEELDETDQVLTEKSTAIPKEVALLFEFTGDQKATRHALVNCFVTRAGLSGSTKTSSAEPGTKELSFTAAPRETDNVVKISTTADTPALVYDAWYMAVYEKAAA